MAAYDRGVARANVFGSEFGYDGDDPDGYRAGIARVGQQAGGMELAVKLFEIPPGQSLCPYHYEYVEEWLIVLDGAVTVRVPDGEQRLERGDVVCYPPGPDGAHKVSAAGAQAARVLMFSSAAEPSVAVYPDSDKIGVWPGNPRDNVMLRREDGQRGYYDRER
jgi:uncharacterized cupin superfamily protein